MAATPPVPRLADALLRWTLPAEDAEAIAGDLAELFTDTIVHAAGIRGARRWYWRQVVSVLCARAVAVVRDALAESAADGSRRSLMAAFRQDLSYAIRSLRKQPAFTTLSVGMLALGLGATIAIFALTFAVLFKPLPFREPSQLMLVHLLAPELENPAVTRTIIWSYPKYQMLRDHQQAFESTGAFAQWNWNVTGSSTPERVTGEMVEAGYFTTLGIGAHIGRAFSPEETSAPGSTPLAMLGHGLWTTRFGGDPQVIGRTIGLNGTPHTIVGVLPAGFRGLTGEGDIWVPLTTQSAEALGEKWNHSYWVVARRKAGVSNEQAQASVGILGGRIHQAFLMKNESRPWGATAVPLNDERVDPIVRRSILLLLGAVSAVLLIVCINLANLTLVRGLARQREVAIRAALGASRLRIVRQLMTESALLALCGAVAGVAVAYLALTAGAALIPDLRTVLPRDQTAGLTRIGLGGLGLDGTTLLFTIALAAAAALLFGLAPAWRVSRRDLTATIKSGAAGAIGVSRRGLALRNLLIVGELAVALVVLTAAGLMLKSVARLQATELGFDPRSVMTVRLALPMPQYSSPRNVQLVDQLLERLEGQASLSSVAFGSCAPVSGFCNRTSVKFPDELPRAGDGELVVGILWASPGYFDTLGIRLVRGRLFTAHDRVGQPKVAIVNETAARTFWGDQDPIGRRVALGQGGFQDGAEVVGVVADVRYASIETTVMSDVYIPLLQAPRSLGYLFARSDAPPDTVIATIRREMRALDPDLPLTDIKLMATRFGEATWRQRTSAWLLGVFAALALVLAALGIYGVMSQGVEQRTREIGVRMALGAARGDIMRLLITRALVIAVAGIGLGIVLAVPASRLLTTLLYQVRPGDPAVFAALAGLLFAVTLLAGFVPARRATRVDPLTTLRSE